MNCRFDEKGAKLQDWEDVIVQQDYNTKHCQGCQETIPSKPILCVANAIPDQLPNLNFKITLVEMFEENELESMKIIHGEFSNYVTGWAKIIFKVCHNLISSMSRRCQAGLEAKNSHTEYSSRLSQKFIFQIFTISELGHYCYSTNS